MMTSLRCKSFWMKGLPVIICQFGKTRKNKRWTDTLTGWRRIGL